MSSLKRVWQIGGASLVSAIVAGVIFAQPLAAQAARTGSLRAYWHIFIAYAVAWIVVVAWLIHIARRLRRVTEDGP